ncbi:unnamed protein product [Cuscuta campestris]|uniref:Uncharacterized protein n=1 Tax=Cuscuta campestris TaxID=132261 RepID=A0A484ND58_9ASTE|nr:unnamed protein product [Cuscuta campestris]
MLLPPSQKDLHVSKKLCSTIPFPFLLKNPTYFFKSYLSHHTFFLIIYTSHHIFTHHVKDIFGKSTQNYLFLNFYIGQSVLIFMGRGVENRIWLVNFL